jgi:hypothetical protein
MILVFLTSIYQKNLKIILNKKNQISFYFHFETQYQSGYIQEKSIKEEDIQRMTENKSNQSHGIRNQKMDQICLYIESP